MSRARLRLVDVASGSYTELVGNDELAVSVPQIKFVGGMRMTEIVKDLKLTGCEQITLDTCTLDASSTANTLAVSNDIISLGSKVSIAAESLVRPYRTHTITVRADDTMALQAERYHITFERRYEMERIRILVPLRRRSPVERSRHRHHSERRAFQLTFVPARWTGRCGELKHPSFRPAFRTYPHLSPNILNSATFMFSNSVAQTVAGRLL
jgi:3D (Asp-Asp-Asp) domain-containing protein